MASAASDELMDCEVQRIRLEERHLQKYKAEKIADKWREQDKYIDYLESKLDLLKDQSKSKLESQNQDSTRRENILIMRLASKEQEAQDMMVQIQELKQALAPSTSNLRATLLDPCINLLFEKMQGQIKDLQTQLDEAKGELSAWTFTADSVTGKKLMGKCRMLIDENEELGRQLSQGRVAQLQAELALQKSANEEQGKNLDEMTGFVVQLDEEVEGMQATILHLQQQLKQAQDKAKERPKDERRERGDEKRRDEKEEKDDRRERTEEKRREEKEEKKVEIKVEKVDAEEDKEKRRRSEDEGEKKKSTRSRTAKDSKKKHKEDA